MSLGTWFCFFLMISQLSHIKILQPHRANQSTMPQNTGWIWNQTNCSNLNMYGQYKWAAYILKNNFRLHACLSICIYVRNVGHTLFLSAAQPGVGCFQVLGSKKIQTEDQEEQCSCSHCLNDEHDSAWESRGVGRQLRKFLTSQVTLSLPLVCS